MAIPKIIHYVWMGQNPKSKDIKRCMRTWQKHLKDYQVMEWNEQNFDIQSNRFVREAYRKKKWAFVSDYVRMYAIYRHGGIYLDTDVLVLDHFEQFLENRAFTGFETMDFPFTAAFGAEPGHPLVKDMLDYYDRTNFEYDKNDQVKNVNTKIVGEHLIEAYGCVPNNKDQMLREGIRVYPDYILCNPSKHSSAIHIFTSTWREDYGSLAIRIAKFFRIRLTSKRRAGIYKWLTDLKHKI